MKEKKEEIYLKIKNDIEKLWSRYKLGNTLMEKIQKNSQQLLNNSLEKGILTDSEVKEVAGETETYIFSLVEEKLSNLLYNLGEETKALLHSNKIVDRETGKNNLKQFVSIKRWINETDLDNLMNIRNWIDNFLQENYSLN